MITLSRRLTLLLFVLSAFTFKSVLKAEDTTDPRADQIAALTTVTTSSESWNATLAYAQGQASTLGITAASDALSNALANLTSAAESAGDALAPAASDSLFAYKIAQVTARLAATRSAISRAFVALAAAGHGQDPFATSLTQLNQQIAAVSAQLAGSPQ